MSHSYTGSCSCRKIQYRVSLPAEAEIPKVVLCHCINCKHNSGSAFSSNFIVPQSALTFTTGTPKVFIDSADVGGTCQRQFCGDCGTPLTSLPRAAGDLIVIKWGTLDDVDREKIKELGGEIFTRRKDEFLKHLEDEGLSRADAGMPLS